jgi:hypothetical protein
MSKAARRRARRQNEYLVKLSFSDPARFEAAWEIRVESWMAEIRTRAREWRDGGTESRLLLFDIVGRADAVMRECSPGAQRQHRIDTYGLLEAECARLVADCVDRRLFRTNGIGPERLKRMARGPKAEAAAEV